MTRFTDSPYERMMTRRPEGGKETSRPPSLPQSHPCYGCGNYGSPCVGVCIFPSYNDRINSTSSYKYTFGQDGETTDYINFCNVAKRNIGSKNIVLVNSWNNYQKGTNLEPTEENKSEFLKITRNQFKK